MTLQKPPVLTVSSSLELRPWELADAGDLFRLVDQNRKHIGTYLDFVDWTKSPEDTEKFLYDCLRGYIMNSSFHFGIWKDGSLCGTVALQHINLKDRIGEIGFWIAEEFIGQGIVTLSCQKLLDFGFRTLELHRIVIRTSVKNTPSQKIAETLGFELEATLKEAISVRGKFHDECHYSLLSQDFETKKKSQSKTDRQQKSST